MEDPDSVVAVFARNGGRTLLLNTDEGWDCVTAPLAEAADETATDVLDSILGTPGGYTTVRTGSPVTDQARSVRLHPVLLDVFSRDLAAESDRYAWRHPTDLERGAAWDAYRAIAPTNDGIVSDSERGSTALSLDALQVLRDEAASGASWSELAGQAKRVVAERGDLTALVTRVDRTMARAANAATGTAVAETAREELDEAVRADEEAAARAASCCEDATVLTLSQSGTVQAALSMGDPDHVILLESRPECEAIPVAETLASEGIDVSLLLDAAVGEVLARRDVDVVVIGADSIDPNGDVRNKVGTRMLAVAARHEGIPVIAATSSDKVAKGPARDAWVDGGDIYDGPHDIDTACRLFDRTPPDLISEIVTEVGSLTPDTTVRLAAERRSHRQWRVQPDRLQSV